MSWGAIGAAAVGVVGGALAGGKSSGGTTTASKEPWSAAVPWLTSNLNQGQALQQQYMQNPFNPAQQAAYGNLFAGNDYINQLMPSLLATASQQNGFDRSNPRARPQQFSFMGAGGMPAMQRYSGLLGTANGTMNTAANPFAQIPAAAAAPAPAPAASGGFPSDWNGYNAGP